MARLSPDFLRSLTKLRINFRGRHGGVPAGQRLSRRKGGGIEFADYRAYVPGDEIRYLDWRAYARLDRLYLRQYSVDEGIGAYLMVDCSRSMNGEKRTMAVSLAGAIAIAALSGYDRPMIVPFGQGMIATHSISTRRGMLNIMEHVEAIPGSHDTSLRSALMQFMERFARPGLLCIFSDMFTRDDYVKPMRRLLAQGFELAIIHILSPEEINPTVRGDLSLVDSETGDQVDSTIDDEQIRSYLSRLDSFRENLLLLCKRNGIRYAFVDAGRSPYDVTFSDLRRSGILI